jgi:dihydrofolate reductase
MRLITIAAMAPGRVIGNKGQLPWDIPAEMAHFKRTTEGHIVIMGRKTWESIPPRYRPLSMRENWIISSKPGGHLAGTTGVSVFSSPREALQEFRRRQARGYGGDAYVIGGAAIYDALLPFCDEMVLSRIYNKHEGDAFFPRFDHLFDLQPFEGDGAWNDGFGVFRYRRRRPDTDPRELVSALENARYTVAELTQQVRFLATRLDESDGNVGHRINAFRQANKAIDIYAHLAPMVPHMPGEQQGVGEDKNRWGAPMTTDPFPAATPSEKEVTIESEESGAWSFRYSLWRTETGWSGKLVRGMQEKSPYIPPDESWCEEHDQWNAAIDGVESMTLAYLCATGGVVTTALQQSVAVAMQSITEYHD